METLADFLETSARRFGPLPALMIKPGFRYHTWTYQQVWDDSAKLAGLLQQRGIGKGDRVLFWAPNRPEWVIAFFACLRLGAIVAPLDVRSAPDFAARVVERTQPKLAIVSRQTPDTINTLEVPQVWLEDQETALYRAAPRFDVPALSGDDIAEIMFTSGTTGNPKGVILTHRNIVSNVVASDKAEPSDPKYRVLSLLPLSHMLEQNGGLLLPLIGGASIVYPVSRQPSIIFKTMQETRVTTIVLVPQALQLFMGAIEREVAKQGKQKQWAMLNRIAPSLPIPARRLLFRSVLNKMGGRLQFFISGGAYLDPALGQKWENMGVVVLQGYGATEAAPVIATNTLTHHRLDALGKAPPGQEIRIAPDGELLARGPNITPGYWQDPEATRAIFTDDGWYRTGDLGAVDAEGYVYFKGRKKDLIVLANGQNVFPEDIENLLHQQPGVTECVVVGLMKDGGNVEVHASLILEEGADPAPVVRQVNQQLAAHQQIGGFSLWPEPDFPRTHTLKIRKHLVLKQLQSGDRATTADLMPPAPVPTADEAAHATPVQRLIAQIAAVPLADVTPEKPLADLGLDSLGRVGLLSAIEAELGVYVDEEQVTSETTVAALERLLGAGSAAEQIHFPAWPRSPVVRAARVALQEALFPFTRLFYDVELRGRENLANVQGPVLFAANHTMALDNPCILMAIGAGWRWRLGVAAAADDIFGNRWYGNALALLGHAFPFSRDKAIRPSLENLGRLLDGGWSVLIYPEGQLTIGGPMQPFKAGTGLVAVESRTPVVPVKVELKTWGLFDSPEFRSWVAKTLGRSHADVDGASPGAKGWRIRGAASVTVGKPIVFPPGTPYLEATEQLERAVRGL